MDKFTALESRFVILPIDNIDTDQIIPARFLKTTEKAGLAPNLFADWRYLPDGSPRLDFALFEPEAEGAKILLAICSNKTQVPARVRFAHAHPSPLEGDA